MTRGGRSARARGARLVVALRVLLGALLPLLVAPLATAAAQGPAGSALETAVPAVRAPLPRPEAGKGAAARADEAARAEDVGATARLSVDAILQAPDAGPAGVAGRIDAARLREGDDLTVYVMTIGQGDAVFTRFGHNALGIRDARRGTDVAYNWGMFDFAQPNFLGRFLTGDTRYWMEGFDGQALAQHYAEQENRSVWVQELALTAAQKVALRDYLEWNAREENKFYRYDYYLDNCSTRVRDAIDRVLGGTLRRTLVGVPTGTTYRSHTRRLLAGDAATYTGIQLALGRPADRPIDAWEESFLPVRFMEHLRRARVRDASGAVVPLVSGERALYQARRAPERAAAPSYALGYLGAGLGVAALLSLLARGVAAGRRGSAALFGVVGGTWTLLIGVLGTALLLAGTVTRHAFMGRNENLLAVSPLGLVLLALVACAVGMRRPATRAAWAGRLARVAAIAAGLAVLGAVLTALPGIGQRSTEVFALIVPGQLALWWGARQLAAARATRGASAAPQAA